MGEESAVAIMLVVAAPTALRTDYTVDLRRAALGGVEMTALLRVAALAISLLYEVVICMYING